MHTIYGKYDDSIGQLIGGYFVRNTGKPLTGPFTAVGWIKNEQLVGQAIFNDFTFANIEIHLHAPNCMNRKTIRDIYDYVFNILKCERLTAKPYCTNEKLLQLLERLGFIYEGSLEKYYKDNDVITDALIYKLTKNNIPNWVKMHA
jgi:hypothetical protein